MTTVNVFDFLIIGCGLYMVYNGIVMKTQKQIKAGVVLGKNADPNNIKDKDGFIAYMWWKLVAMGVMCAISGLLNVILTVYGGDSSISYYIQVGMNMLFFLLLLIYSVITMKAQKKYITQ